MHTVNKSQVDIVKGRPELFAEASEIGLVPGEWPDFIAVLDDAGEGFLFQRIFRHEHSAKYRTADGRFALTVLND